MQFDGALLYRERPACGANVLHHHVDKLKHKVSGASAGKTAQGGLSM